VPDSRREDLQKSNLGRNNPVDQKRISADRFVSGSRLTLVPNRRLAGHNATQLAAVQPVPAICTLLLRYAELAPLLPITYT
jgi:hypothetical protein